MVFLLTPNHQLPFLAAVSILPSTAPFPVLHLPFSVFFFFSSSALDWETR
jgi:hypothetical protein